MRRLDGADWRSFATLAFAASLVVFFCASRSSRAIWCCATPRSVPTNHTNELRSLRPAPARPAHTGAVLRRLLQVGAARRHASSPLLQSPIPAPVQPAKPWSYGQPLDFDSVDAATLDRFDYVITTRTTAQSEPPAELPPRRTLAVLRGVAASRADDAAARAARVRAARRDPRLPHRARPAHLARARESPASRPRRATRQRGALAPGGVRAGALDLPPATGTSRCRSSASRR